MYPKNSRSALAALMVAGGLWAYKNRDKVRGWLSQQTGGQPSKTLTNEQPFTGDTRRFGETSSSSFDYSGDERTHGLPES
jgi:hypothetical protein